MNNPAELDSVLIVAAKRTPMASLLGDFTAVSAPKLGGTAIAACLEQVDISACLVDDVYMGNVISAGA